MNPHIPSMDEYKQFFYNSNSSNQNLSLVQTYPALFNSKNRINLRVIKDQNNNPSFIGQKTLLTKSPVGIYKISCLSGLYSTSDYISQNLIDLMIESQIRNAENQNCDLMITWPSQYNYSTHGFINSGLEYRYSLKAFEYKKNLNFKLLDHNKISVDAIYNLYSKHSVNSFRKKEDFRKFLQIPGNQIFTAWDKVNKLRGYAILGKGSNLDNFIHEWAGDIDGLMHLFAHLSKDLKPPQLLIPHHSFNLRKMLNLAQLPVSINYLGLMKVINHKSLIKKAQQAALNLGYNNFHMAKQGSSYFVGFANEILQLKSDQELLHLLFGPTQKINWEGLSPEYLKAVHKIFPLPLWIWGWDSV